MKTSTTFLEWAKHRLEEIGRVRAWSVLRTMDPGLLERAGISPALIEKGPDAWPWRAENPRDRASTEFSIDERGAPVPIGSTDELDGFGERESSHPSHRNSTTLAA